jgi:3-dehydroquinate dehydratase/shikimate dehydrogenase
VAELFRAARETKGSQKIIIGMGPFAVCTRVLAKQLGCTFTYTTPEEDDIQLAAPGQLTPQTLVDFYRFRELNVDTKIYAVTGYPLLATSSPEFFNNIFKQEKMNCVYLPLPARSIEYFLELADEIGLCGASVTVPHKEKVIPHLSHIDPKVESVGACNTIVRTPNMFDKSEGWSGYNTDIVGFSETLLAFIKKSNLRFRGVTIIGAGGAAKAIAGTVFALGGKALILNRSAERAKELAGRYRGFRWAPLDEYGAKKINWFYRQIIIQCTNVGMAPDEDSDPLSDYQFRGSEYVMDIIYKPETTKMLARAKRAGCKIQNGYDMLTRQAKAQYNLFFPHCVGAYPAALV